MTADLKTNGDAIYCPGSLVMFVVKNGLNGMGVDFFPRTTEDRYSRDTSVFSGDLFLVLKGRYPIALTEYRELYCFRLNKNVWVNVVFADHYEEIA